ncbi:putative MFS family arabinose efflux permease [Geodermatophilus tzadiensis]|uniref:Putative MFS family arabinose efflux permease n=1 Tax=Geodermatophilus tzadiensis TaxID=1137988 RepID=A0A2T0T3D5_9ACTN|nr:MFS transporter [Geodermatophilus tzadiensis]PRY40195.1 putative MFS family arabinose efflux permease [Geodermatophilus tzadiensis]
MSPRTVLGPLLGPYAHLFRAVPGAAWFSLAGWVARLPLPMLGLGAVLLVEGYSGSYALAGAVSGTLALSAAVAGPLWSRAMDRRGQGAVLRRAMAAYLVTGLSLVAVVVGDAPTWTWFLLAALTGASLPNIGAMVRSRWAAALADAERRQTAFAFEAVVDEVVFVVGPPLVTVLGTLVAPAAGFTTGIVLGTVGGLWLARQRGTEPAVVPVAAGTTGGAAPRRTAALTPAVLVVCAAYLGVGTVFGAMDVVVVGFAESVGAPALAGLALALYAGGSLLAGLAYGVARLRGSLAARFLVTAVAFGLAAQALWAVSSLPLLVGAGFLAGLAVAPVLVSGASLAESRVPRAALTEALAWTNTGLTLGVTAGSALAGAAVDAWGAQRAFAVPALAAAAAALIALAGAPLLRTRPAAPAEGAVSRVGDAVGG